MRLEYTHRLFLKVLAHHYERLKNEFSRYPSLRACFFNSFSSSPHPTSAKGKSCGRNFMAETRSVCPFHEIIRLIIIASLASCGRFTSSGKLHFCLWTNSPIKTERSTPATTVKCLLPSSHILLGELRNRSSV